MDEWVNRVEQVMNTVYDEGEQRCRVEKIEIKN